MNGKTILVGLVFFLLCSVAVYFYGRHRGYENGYDKCYPVAFNAGYDSGYVAPHPADTIIRIDTILIEKPVPVEREVVRTDTLVVNDTIVAQVPIEAVLYGGKPGDEYRAQVSGWHTSMDWIEVFPRTQVINNYIDRPVPYDHPVPFKWTISAFAEASVTLNYYNARAGLMYDQQISGRWRGYAAAGYEYGSLGKGPFAEVGTKLNILQK